MVGKFFADLDKVIQGRILDSLGNGMFLIQMGGRTTVISSQDMEGWEIFDYQVDADDALNDYWLSRIEEIYNG